MRAHLIKLTSVILSLFMLAQSSLPAYAQAYKENPFPFHISNNGVSFDEEKFSINAKFLTIGNTLSFEDYKSVMSCDEDLKSLGTISTDEWKDLYFEYKKAVVAEEDAVAAAYNYINTTHKYGPKDAALVANDPKSRNENGDICDEGECFAPLIYNRALLRALLKDGAGVDETDKEWRWNDELMLAPAKNIYNIISEYGISLADIAFAQKYFRFLINKTNKHCDNDVYMADIMPGSAGGEGRADARQGKEERRASCEKLGYIALSLGLLDELSVSDKNENAELLYKQLKNNYRKDYGALVLGNYVTALLLTGNDKAYQLLEKFLLKDSLSDGLRFGNVWQVLGRVFDVILIKAWLDKAIDINDKIRGRGGRYLNEVGLRFQYLDEETAKEYGYSDFNISMAKDGQSGYNMPYGNLLEDIGVLLSQWPDNRARAIANKAVNNYALALQNSNEGYFAVHIPLVTGAIKGGGANGGNTHYVMGKLYNLDWWDLNEGTQRRVNNIMARVSGDYGAGYKPEKTENTIKISRSENTQKIARLAIWGDILISAILMTSFIVSLPSLAKGTASFIKSLKSSKAAKIARMLKVRGAGKKALLERGAGNVKKSGTTAAKQSVQDFKRSATISAAEKKARNAVKTIKKRTKDISLLADKYRKARVTSDSPKILAAKTPLNEGTAKMVLSGQTVKGAPAIEGERAVLTATIGEGGGAAAQGGSELTRAQRLLLSKREAESGLKIVQEALELSQPAVSQPFKPGWFFNKPYKELPKWKRFIANQYFSWILRSWDISEQIAKGSIRNPVKAFSGLTLSAAPGVNLFSPAVIAAPVSQGPQTAFRTAYHFSDAFGGAFNITKAAPTLTTTVEFFSNTSKTAANAANGIQKGAAGTKQIFSIFALPKIEGILNEFHGGPSARLKANYASASLFAPISTDYSPAATPNQENTAAYNEQKPALQNNIGYDEFEYFAVQLLKRQKVLKDNKNRAQQLLAAARYISPKLTSELLDLLEGYAYGPRIFDMYMDEILEAIGSLQPGEVITLSGYRIPLIKGGPLEEWRIRKSLLLEESALEDVFEWLSSTKNIMVQSAIDRALSFPEDKQRKVLKNLIDIKLRLNKAGAPKRSYLVGLTGDDYEWENFSHDDVLRLALGKEIKQDLYKELSKKKKESYPSLLSKYRQWLISVLGASKKTPAVWHENSEGTVFIYSYDGQVRIRVGWHEITSVKQNNFHIHLEYRHAADGNWKGPINYKYAWLNQNILPVNAFKDMVQIPIDYMTSKGILIKKEELKSPNKPEKKGEKRPNLYFLSNSKDGSAPIEDYEGSSSLLPKDPTLAAAPNPFNINFKGKDKSLIPLMTLRALSIIPYNKTIAMLLKRAIKRDLAKVLGGPDYLDSWRKKMRLYDVSPYRESLFSVLVSNRYNATAFMTEYLGMKFLLTNRHVVGKAKQVQLFDSDLNMFEADVIAQTTDREGMDLALLLPKDIHILDKYNPLSLSLKPMPETGGGLYTIGYPGSGYRFIKKPLLMFERDETSRYPLIDVLPSVLEGTSGSPLMLPSSEKGKDGVAGIAHMGGEINSFFIPTLTIKSFLKKTIRLGLSNPYFDNNIFYNAGLFKGYDSFREKFLLDDSFWMNSISGKKKFPSYGFEHGRKVDDIYIPLILKETKPDNIP